MNDLNPIPSSTIPKSVGAFWVLSIEQIKHTIMEQFTQELEEGLFTDDGSIKQCFLDFCSEHFSPRYTRNLIEILLNENNTQ